MTGEHHHEFDGTNDYIELNPQKRTNPLVKAMRGPCPICRNVTWDWHEYMYARMCGKCAQRKYDANQTITLLLVAALGVAVMILMMT